MNKKQFVEALNGVWLITETAAHHWGEIVLKVLSNELTLDGLLNASDIPYRAEANGRPSTTGPVMVIPVNGIMMKNDYCGSPGTATMKQWINDANNNSSIKSIVLSIDSPGGNVDGTEALAAAVSNSKKPVVAQGDLMGSAAYWVASQAKEIYISGKTAAAGSIGTMAVLRDTRQMDQQRGIKTVHIFASRSTDKNKATLDAMDGNDAAYKTEFLDPINAVFEASVIKGRSGKVDMQKEDVGTGKVYIGNKAVAAGLADRIGSLETAIRRSIQLADNQQPTTTNNKLQTNTMAFQKTLTAANSTEFQVVDGGFLLEEQHLNRIEAHITDAETTAAALTQERDEAVQAQTTLQVQLNTANTEKQQLQTQIDGLNATIATIRANAAGDFTTTTKTGADDLGSGKQKAVSQITEEANKKRAVLGLQPVG